MTVIITTVYVTVSVTFGVRKVASFLPPFAAVEKDQKAPDEEGREDGYESEDEEFLGSGFGWAGGMRDDEGGNIGGEGSEIGGRRRRRRSRVGWEKRRLIRSRSGRKWVFRSGRRRGRRRRRRGRLRRRKEGLMENPTAGNGGGGG